jgi:hypothetical protein
MAGKAGLAMTRIVKRIGSEDLKRVAHDNAVVVARYADAFAGC